jgi:hypothetical protein
MRKNSNFECLINDFFRDLPGQNMYTISYIYAILYSLPFDQSSQILPANAISRMVHGHQSFPQYFGRKVMFNIFCRFAETAFPTSPLAYQELSDISISWVA